MCATGCSFVTRNRLFKVLKQMAEAECWMRINAEAATEGLVEHGAYAEKVFREMVQEALQMLTSQQRRVFELIKINGLT
jgi:DNA-directed RNA polymerase specialized sigma24 family protein